MRLKKIFAAVLVAGALSVAPAMAASADSTTVEVAGGLWQYGVENGTVFSNFHHPTRSHTATACDGAIFMECVQTAAVANAWARASTGATWLGGNTAYYNVL